jgi:hypothetical protein
VTPGYTASFRDTVKIVVTHANTLYHHCVMAIRCGICNCGCPFPPDSQPQESALRINESRIPKRLAPPSTTDVYEGPPSKAPTYNSQTGRQSGGEGKAPPITRRGPIPECYICGKSHGGGSTRADFGTILTPTGTPRSAGSSPQQDRYGASSQ